LESYKNKKKKKRGEIKNEKKKLLTICPEPCPFSSSKTKNTLKRNETFNQESNQVEDIEPTRTPSKKELLPNRCPNW